MRGGNWSGSGGSSGPVNLASGSAVTGVLPKANGGIGAASFAAARLAALDALLDSNHIHRWKLDDTSGDFVDSGTSSQKVNLTATGSPVYAVQTPWGSNGVLFGVDGNGASNTNHGRALVSAFNDLPNTGVTLECWVQPYTAAFNFLFGADHTTNMNFAVDGSTSVALTVNASGFQSVSSIASFAPVYGMGWHHVAATYDGSFQRLYWNGELVVRQSNTGNVQWSNGTTPRICLARKQAGSQFIGKMARFLISNTARDRAYCQSVTAAGLY